MGGATVPSCHPLPAPMAIVSFFIISIEYILWSAYRLLLLGLPFTFILSSRSSTAFWNNFKMCGDQMHVCRMPLMIIRISDVAIFSNFYEQTESNIFLDNPYIFVIQLNLPEFIYECFTLSNVFSTFLG